MDNTTRRKRRDALIDALTARTKLIMGILNVTPDSFSDGGTHSNVEESIEHARVMIAQGADIIDVGGESTRPGAPEVDGEEEWRRIEGPIRRVHYELDAPISVDTYKAGVARRAAAAGAVMINDVWGLTRDPDMPAAVAETGCLAVITYNHGSLDAGIDVRAGMMNFFSRAFDIATRHGIPKRHLVLDPGVGFNKTPEQNLSVLAHVGELAETGCPVLVGVSRKSFIGRLTGRSVEDRLAGTLAVGLDSWHRGASILRVHDVAAHRDALTMLIAIDGAP